MRPSFLRFPLVRVFDILVTLFGSKVSDLSFRNTLRKGKKMLFTGKQYVTENLPETKPAHDVLHTLCSKLL